MVAKIIIIALGGKDYTYGRSVGDDYSYHLEISLIDLFGG